MSRQIKMNKLEFPIEFLEAAFSRYSQSTEAAIQRCSYEKVFWKYAANSQENTHAEVWFQ